LLGSTVDDLQVELGIHASGGCQAPAGAAAEVHDVSDPAARLAAQAAESRAAALAALEAVSAVAGKRLAEGASLEARSVGVVVSRGAEEALASFRVRARALRDDDGLSVVMDTLGDEAPSPIHLEARLPIRAGDVVLRFQGGPVSLARLGIAEGAWGLIDVDKASLVGDLRGMLSRAQGRLEVGGLVEAAAFGIRHPRVALAPVRVDRLTIAGEAEFDADGRLRLEGVRLHVGDAQLRLDAKGQMAPSDAKWRVQFAVDRTECDALVRSLPSELLPLGKTLRFEGAFQAAGTIEFTSASSRAPTLVYSVDDGCRVAAVPDTIAPARFRTAFRYSTYHPDGTRAETETGPGTEAWADLGDISPYMIAAVVTTEDGAFYKHAGFNHLAIRESFAANMKSGRFVRGASTISMQLAKNLFLTRDKTISRKVEEMILTDYLEQVFDKDELMELYLNVIELGPDVYGVKRAAEYYFGVSPAELSVSECFFLASLLPSPNRFQSFIGRNEVVPDYWVHKIHELMKVAAKRGVLSQAELTDGLLQPLRLAPNSRSKPDAKPPVRKGFRPVSREPVVGDREGPS